VLDPQIEAIFEDHSQSYVMNKTYDFLNLFILLKE